MELAMPEVEELFPVELKVEAALEDWLNSESSLSRVLNEFFEVFVIIFLLPPEWLKFKFFLLSVGGEKEFLEEMEEPVEEVGEA